MSERSVISANLLLYLLLFVKPFVESIFEFPEVTIVIFIYNLSYLFKQPNINDEILTRKKETCYEGRVSARSEKGHEVAGVWFARCQQASN